MREVIIASNLWELACLRWGLRGLAGKRGVMPSRASPLPHAGASGNNFNKSPSNQAQARIKRLGAV